MTTPIQKNNFTDTLAGRNPGVNWRARLGTSSRKFLSALERFSLTVEKPFVWLFNDARFNPLYHTGTITIFLLFVILITGVYLLLFYPFGFTVSYQAVSNIEANVISRVVRALHRYASDAAVIFALLHGWRTFFQDRFRGPRWLAWMTGVGMAVVVWFIGITGYWLIWDERAQVLNQTLFNILDGFQSGQKFLVDYVVGEAAGTGWIFILFIALLHIGLSILTGLFLWWHLLRMSRAKWFPPRYWMVISIAVLILASILFPVGMLPRADASQLPAQTPVDFFYLFYLSAFLRGPQALFWSVLLFIIGISLALPFIMPRAKEIKPIELDLAHCDGCTLCERDCPYTAIKMIPRTDGARPKFQAEIDPNLCVSCGVCIGSCPDNALSFGLPLDSISSRVLELVTQNKNKKIIFTCERHALANPNIFNANELVIPLTCIAMASPDLAAQALQAGASEVQFIGCPPEDCANREGNIWQQERLTGARLPKLKPNFIPQVQTAWVAPAEFKTSINSKVESQPTAYTFSPNQKHARYILPLLGVMAVMLAFQLWLSSRPMDFFSADSTTLAIHFTHHSGYAIRDIANPAPADIDLVHPVRIVLEVDGKVMLDETYPMNDTGVNQGARIFERVTVPTGEHHLLVKLYDRPDDSAQTLLDENVTLGAREIHNIAFRDVHVPDPVAGEKLYYDTSADTNAGCRICHSLEKEERIVGPSFYGVATRAATRIPGMSAEDYLRQSILDPDAYIVEGYPKGQMLKAFSEILSEEQIQDLIAFLMTMK
jgi:ferredoxin/coenzyme F420-reducing hydrogenase delta subunit/cytochrome c2